MPVVGLPVLAADLRDLMARGVDRRLDDDAFDAWALRVFRYQLEANPVYRSFASGRGVSAESVDHWTGVPAVPTAAFKHLPLVSGDPARVARVFRTSGTSEGSALRGEHHVPDLELYRASLLPNARAHLLPDGARLPVLSLVPSPEESPDSSLSFMVGTIVEELGGEGSGWFVDPVSGIREEAFLDALRRSEADDVPLLVTATGFALVHWMDAMDRRGWRVRLPDGSRIMETGGFKGRSRSVDREALYEGLQERLGVPPERVVDEYGMTELLSQFYEPVLREGEAAGGPMARRLVGPPWVRTRVLDPRTLEPVSPGVAGVLCHMDLANAGSVAHVLTEDRGVLVDGGFRVLGRLEGSEARGCSIAMDELLARARA